MRLRGAKNSNSSSLRFHSKLNKREGQGMNRGEWSKKITLPIKQANKQKGSNEKSLEKIHSTKSNTDYKGWGMVF